MTYRLIALSLATVFLIVSSSPAQTRRGSQVLAAYFADHILVGEVVKLSEPNFGGMGITTQVVTFRKVEVVKGQILDELVLIQIGFSGCSQFITEQGDGYGLSKSGFAPGEKFIILFNTKLSGGRCSSSPQNLDLSCYIHFTTDLIPYSEDELKAIRLLASGTYKRR